jgi:valyl-tRNA synthetase
MSEISKAYEPQSVEDKWYQFWLDGKFFVANENSAKPAYSIVIPPPNVTGVLTMGHVLNNTIQDILCRKARMEGKEVLWLPGTDHAGIATQNAVEKNLKKAGEIKHRDDLGREAMVAKIWDWKNKYGGIIIQQLKKLGASCDWSRERFTMDPDYSRCVQRVFVDLYKKGLIYRGKRMVNWCPASLTALSDEEVVMKEQRGFMYYFKVQVAESPLTPTLSPVGGEGEKRAATHSAGSLSHTGGKGQGEGAASKGGPQIDSEGRVWLTIATTRPETIPGDTAVAVNPKDPRYAHLIGKHIIRPLPVELPREQKLIPIIGDEHVDFAFGTGVLKVTPAHDKADFEIGARHKLPMIEVIDATGHMNDAAGADLRGLDRFKARKVAVEKLTELGALEKEEPYTNNVGYSERADVPIEPRLSEQWFLKYPSVEKARECVEQSGNSEGRVTRVPNPESQGLAELVPPTDKMKFHPERWAKVYDHWMGGLQDWCISRQLWWGHRIPVWRKESLDLTANTPNGFANNTALAQFMAAMDEKGFECSMSDKPGHTTLLRCNEEAEYWEAATDSPEEAQLLQAAGFTQDPDVLDTWFSSWLWPFATMGWPEQTATLKKFYPTTDLVTGPDIIFFWVARMIMAGYEYMGDAKFALPDAMPFQNVYFTGIIRDKQGRKMSKSLGNSPDPLDLIAKYGADALRFGVMRAAPLGQDILFDEQNVELGRNFCNKLWNACRFRQMVGSADFPIQGEIEPTLLSSDDKWILLKLDAAIREVTIALNEYKFSDATAALYRFFWSEYCDWYVEATKAVFFGTDDKRKANTLAVIDFVLSHTVRMFHPFLPFITEELWHGMGYSTDMPDNQGGRTIMFAPWPKSLDEDFKGHYGLDDCYLEIAGAKYELVSQGRNLRREANISTGKKIRYVLKPVNFIPPHDLEVIRLLLNAETVDVNENYLPPKGTLTARTELGELYLPLEGLRTPEELAAEKARVTKELEKIEAEITKVEQKLANPKFTEKVPPAVLQEHSQRLTEWLAKRESVKAALDALS